MKVFFLGAYSDKGREGMMASSYDARVKAVSAMVERAGAKLGSVDYLQGPFDVIADAEVDSYETASGLQAVMMASGGWDELLLLPTMDVDKALNVARTVGGYPMSPPTTAMRFDTEHRMVLTEATMLSWCCGMVDSLVIFMWPNRLSAEFTYQ